MSRKKKEVQFSPYVRFFGKMGKIEGVLIGKD